MFVHGFVRSTCAATECQQSRRFRRKHLRSECVFCTCAHNVRVEVVLFVLCALVKKRGKEELEANTTRTRVILYYTV